MFSFQFLKQFIEEGGGVLCAANHPVSDEGHYVNRLVLAVCSAAVEIRVLQGPAFDKYYLTKM